MPQLLARVDMRPVRAGWAAHAHALGLAGHGPTPQEARASLVSGIEALARGLESAGCLDEALGNLDIEVRAGSDQIEVVLTDASRD